MSQTLETNKVSSRNYGIDLLRNLSMFFVVLLHVLGDGGMLKGAEGEPLKYEALKVIHIAAMCAVNCYGIISGYVGFRSKFRISSIATMWLQVFLYSAGIGVLFFLFMPGSVTLGRMVKLCLPMISHSYWYFTAYFALFFTMPLLNAGIERLSRRQFEISFCILLVLLTVGQQTRDTFGTSSGYSYLWLMMLYCVGGYLGKYQIKPKKIICLAVYIGCVALAWVAQYMMRQLGMDKPTRLEFYNSPFMLIMGVMLVLLFANMKLPGWVKKAAGFLAPASFGVFLIHVHPVLWEVVWKGAFTKFGTYPTWATVPLAVGLALAIYLLCSAADLVRHYLFKATKVKMLLSKFDKKLLPDDGGNI